MAVWLRVASEIVTLLWVLDLATKGRLSEQARYRVDLFCAGRDRERRIKVAANHAIWRAIQIVEGVE